MACSNSEDLSTDTRSTQFSDRQEKLAFLHRYVKRTPGLSDADYHIGYFDNGQGRISGPSEWDIRLVAKVDPDSINAWCTELTEDTAAFPLTTWRELIADTNRWELRGEHKVYRGPYKVLVAFPEVSTVLYVFSTTSHMLH